MRGCLLFATLAVFCLDDYLSGGGVLALTAMLVTTFTAGVELGAGLEAGDQE